MDFDEGGRKEGSLGRGGGERQLKHRRAGGTHALDVRVERGARVGVDHRPDVRVEAARVADDQFRHRALEHGEHALGDVALQAEYAQRRAALAGAVEGRHDRIGNDLLGQRGAVDDHRVLATGFSDQHRVVVAPREHTVDRAARPRSNR